MRKFLETHEKIQREYDGFFNEGVSVFKWAMNQTKAPEGEKRHEPAWEYKSKHCVNWRKWVMALQVHKGDKLQSHCLSVFFSNASNLR